MFCQGSNYWNLLYKKSYLSIAPILLIVILCFIFRFPNIACELLTSDVSIINDKLGGEESLLEMLYHFLEQDPPLNPLLASFFSKTIGNLIARKTEQVESKKDGGSHG